MARHGQVGLLHLQHPGLIWDPVHRQKGLLHRVRAGSECQEGTCFAIAATPDLSLTFMSSRANRGFTHKDVRASVPLRRTSFISRSRTSPPVPRVALASVSALPACTFRARPAPTPGGSIPIPPPAGAALPERRHRGGDTLGTLLISQPPRAPLPLKTKKPSLPFTTSASHRGGRTLPERLPRPERAAGDAPNPLPTPRGAAPGSGGVPQPSPPAGGSGAGRGGPGEEFGGGEEAPGTPRRRQRRAGGQVRAAPLLWGTLRPRGWPFTPLLSRY